MSAHGKTTVTALQTQGTSQQEGAQLLARGADSDAGRGALAPSGVQAVSCAPGGSAVQDQFGGLAHLEELRAELDATDAALLEAIRQRLDVCARIGRHKKRFAIPMMQPQRIGVVQARAAAFAQAHGLRPEFLHALYVQIIEETCRLEEEIIGQV